MRTGDERRPDGGDPLDATYSAADIAPETLAKMEADCAAFYAAHSVEIAAGEDGGGYSSFERAGHDLWLTRNGHGAGFWDRPEAWGAAASKRMTDAAHAMGEFDLYIGDDGRIHGSPL